MKDDVLRHSPRFALTSLLMVYSGTMHDAYGLYVHMDHLMDNRAGMGLRDLQYCSYTAHATAVPS